MSWLFSAPTISLPFLKEPIRNPLNYVFGDIAKTTEKPAQKKNATQSLYMSARPCTPPRQRAESRCRAACSNSVLGCLLWKLVHLILGHSVCPCLPRESSCHHLVRPRSVCCT